MQNLVIIFGHFDRIGGFVIGYSPKIKANNLQLTEKKT